MWHVSVRSGVLFQASETPARGTDRSVTGVDDDNSDSSFSQDQRRCISY